MRGGIISPDHVGRRPILRADPGIVSFRHDVDGRVTNMNLEAHCPT
jgi:hypothetical protein